MGRAAPDHEHPEKDRQSREPPMGRWGSPEELMGPVVVLALYAASYVTGQVHPRRRRPHCAIAYGPSAKRHGRTASFLPSNKHNSYATHPAVRSPRAMRADCAGTHRQRLVGKTFWVSRSVELGVSLFC